jgi:hypothetical protein
LVGHHCYTGKLEIYTNISQDFDLTCEYVRERKKRGEVSRKDLPKHGTVVIREGNQSFSNWVFLRGSFTDDTSK